MHVMNHHWLTQPHNIWHGGWVVVTVMLGVLVVVVPVQTSAVIMGAGVLGMALMINPLTGIALVLFLAPLRTLINTEAPGLLPLEIGMLTLLVSLGAWAVWHIARGEQLIRAVWTPLYVPIGAFFVVASLTVFVASSHGAWLNEWLKWAVILLCVALVMSYGRWRPIVFALCTAGIAHSVVGLYTFLGGSGALHLLINDRFFRAFGSFGQPNPFGGFMGLIAPVAFALTLGAALNVMQVWWTRGIIPLRWVGWCVFFGTSSAFTLAGVVASWSRGAWLAIGVALIVVVVFSPRRWWQSAGLLACLLVIVGAVWASGRLPVSITDRLGTITQELFAFDDVRGVDITPTNYAVIERLAHWQAAVNMAGERFYLGVGMGNYEPVYDQYRLINWKEPLGHAHNYYLNVWAEAGIIGLIVYVLLWAGVFTYTLRATKHPDWLARFASVGLLGTWTYLSLHSLTDSLYVNNMFLHLGFMLGVVALIESQTRMTVRL